MVGLVSNVFKAGLSEGSIYIKGQSGSIHDQFQPETKNLSKQTRTFVACWTRISEDSPGGFYLLCRNFLKSHWSWALILSFLFYRILFLSLLHNPISVSLSFFPVLWTLSPHSLSIRLELLSPQLTYYTGTWRIHHCHTCVEQWLRDKHKDGCKLTLEKSLFLSCFQT